MDREEEVGGVAKVEEKDVHGEVMVDVHGEDEVESLAEMEEDVHGEQEEDVHGAEVVDNQVVGEVEDVHGVEEVHVLDMEAVARRARIEKLLAEMAARSARMDEMSARLEALRSTTMLRPEPLSMDSTCEVCVQPPDCNKCGVRGDISIFLCNGCRLPPPTDLRCCSFCKNPIVGHKYWCKDCATTVAIDKNGICMICYRRPPNYVEEEDVAAYVPDTEANE